MGVSALFEVKRAGWYPKGGGEAHCNVMPVKSLSPIEIVKRGNLREIAIVSVISNLKRSIAERQANEAFKRLKDLGIPNDAIETSIVELPSIGQGAMLFLLSKFDNAVAGFSSLGEVGKPAEKVADEAPINSPRICTAMLLLTGCYATNSCSTWLWRMGAHAYERKSSQCMHTQTCG